MKACTLASLFAILVAGPALQAPAAPVKKEPAKTGQKPKLKEYRFPGTVDGALPFTPKKPDTKADEDRRKAMAWYMTGQIRQRRNDFNGALDAYRKAVELDPKAIAIYRSLVPLAFRLNRTRDAIQYARKAVELDPNDWKLARTLAIFFVEQRKIPDAVKLLEIAAKSNSLEKHSSPFVTIHRDLGVLYRAMGAKQKAADSYQVVFEARLDPKKYNLDERTRRRLETEALSTYERIGNVFLEADRSELAIKAYKAAQQDRKGKPSSLNYNIAQVYFKTKEYDEALKELQRYLDAQLQTKGRDAYELLVDILKAQKKEKQILPKLEAIAKKDKHNSTLQFFLAEQYVATDRLKDAEALYKKTMAGADDPVGMLGLATIYRKQKQTQDWLKALQAGVQSARNSDQLEKNLAAVEDEVKKAGENKKFVKELIAQGRKDAEGKKPKLTFGGSLVLAKLAAVAKETEATKQFYRFGLKQRPEMATVIFGELGTYLLMNDQYADAVKAFEDAVKHPDARSSRPNFLFRLSQAQELGGNTDKAIEAIHEAQKALPGVGLLHYQEGWIYYHARQFDKAIPIFERVIKEYASNPEITKRCKFSLSNIYIMQGDKVKGAAILEKVYEQDPDDISVNNDLGYLWADQGKNLEQAEKMIRKAVEAEPENAAYLDSMGWVLYKRKRYKEAVPHLEKAVQLPGGGDATIYDHLGDVYDKLGRKKDAKGAWKKALKKAEDARFKEEKLIKSLRKKLGMKRKPADAVKPKR